MHLLDILLHKWLRIPYTLHTHRSRTVKNPAATLVFLHGIGESSGAWDPVLRHFDNEPVTIIAIDLLGFGESPKPDWAQYSAAVQARAVAKTLLLQGVLGNVILVGHSMGSLIAIEIAKRYREAVTSLVLLSPPLYDDKTGKYLPERDQQLKDMYRLVEKYPKDFVQLATIAKKYGLVGPTFNVTNETVGEYVAALQSAIITQTSLHDVAQLTVPIQIVYGSLDPLMVASHFKALEKKHQTINVTSFFGGHEIEGQAVTKVTKAIRQQYDHRA